VDTGADAGSDDATPDKGVLFSQEVTAQEVVKSGSSAGFISYVEANVELKQWAYDNDYKLIDGSTVTKDTVLGDKDMPVYDGLNSASKADTGFYCYWESDTSTLTLAANSSDYSGNASKSCFVPSTATNLKIDTIMTNSSYLSLAKGTVAQHVIVADDIVLTAGGTFFQEGLVDLALHGVLTVKGSAHTFLGGGTSRTSNYDLRLLDLSAVTTINTFLSTNNYQQQGAIITGLAASEGDFTLPAWIFTSSATNANNAFSFLGATSSVTGFLDLGLRILT